MHDLIRLATPELAKFLDSKLSELSENWWHEHVYNRLSYQQQRMVQEYGHVTLSQLDFAALIRILDQNWYELSEKNNFPRDGRTWVKELQSVRNKWAHLSAETIPASEIYRDSDTLGRLLKMIEAPSEILDAVELNKTTAIAEMATTVKVNPTASLEPVMNQNESSTPLPSLFKIGEVVALKSNIAINVPILEVIQSTGEFRYKVFQNNAINMYYESQLQSIVLKDSEQKKINIDELHAHLTSIHIQSPSTTNLFSLRSGRVNFVPYQYRPVLKLIRSDRPRLLIADEVGVGKTIEAGLIIKELRARMDLSSILIICPKALVAERKWFIEMKRFDEQFTALDGKSLRYCLHETHLEGEWPEQSSKAIIPFSLFDSDLMEGHSGRGKKSKGLLDLDPPPKFDLVIVDEAHHIRNSSTYLHQGIRYFCDNAEAVIFLTATPVQLGSNDLYTLLNVLRPDLIIDQSSFNQMAEPNKHINTAVKHCRAASDGWQHEARASLDEVAQTEWGRLFLRESPTFQNIYDCLQNDVISDTERVGITHTIEEMYTFSSLINRTRRRDIGEFTMRKPETVNIAFTPDQKMLHDELLNIIAQILIICHGQQNVKFMMTTIRRQASSCLYGLTPLLQNILEGKLSQLEMMESDDSDEDADLSFVGTIKKDIEALIELSRDLNPYDPKVEAFIQILKDKDKLPNNKALVFSTFRHTLAYLAKYTQSAGLRYGLIHGDVPDDERSVLRHRFSLPKDDVNAIDVLLSSEVGCEGLDFQFCDFLINYDLPWNPMRIEQRIGRIDRYGQKSESVAIVNFITPDTVDSDIYERCLMRIGVFQHAIGGNEEILGEITQELHNIADSFTLTPAERELQLQQLADNSIRVIKEEQELESKQAELFGLNIPNQTWRQEIEAAESYWLSPLSIQRCVSAYLSTRLNSDSDHLLGEKPLKTLRLSQEHRDKLLEDYKSLPRSIEPIFREWEKWLKGGHPTIAVTFDQETAAENPKTIHLSVMHPLVRQAARYLQIKDPVYVTIEVNTNDITPGEYPFAIYNWKKQGVKQDEILVSVAFDDAIEKKLLSLIQSAKNSTSNLTQPSIDIDGLDAKHYSKWITAQANHISENRQFVEYRINSLNVSHRAHCKALEDQITNANNDKIRLMRESQLIKANADFNRRMMELQKSAESGDIHTNAILHGVISVYKEKMR